MPEVPSPAVLLDTCAAIWLANGDPMSSQSRTAIAEAQADAGVFVSPITAWEVATLVARNRLLMTLAPEFWFDRLIDLPGIRLAPMPPRLLIASAFLPGRPPRDPADRIIAATARAHDLAIVTRDSELIPYGQAGYVVTIAC
jgi:PIN domain nuclease of toxin-antitoxin system